MNFGYLNQMIKYIEENLTEVIEYKQLSQTDLYFICTC